MKKIREILFTIVMIASCGCLLNVNIFASLPQNDDLIETESVSPKEEFEKRLQRIHEKMQAEEKECRAKHYKEFYNKFINETLSNPYADPVAILDSFCSNSPYPDEIKEIRIKCQDAILEKQNQNLCAFIKKGGMTRSLNDDYGENEDPVLSFLKKDKSNRIITINEFEKNILNPSPENIISNEFEENILNPSPENITSNEFEENILNLSDPGRNKFVLPGPDKIKLSPEIITSSMEYGICIKPFEEKLAEYEKNEREGNFTPSSVLVEEWEQITEEQKNSLLLPSSLNEEKEEKEDVWSSSSFDSLPYLNEEEEEEEEEEEQVENDCIIS